MASSDEILLGMQPPRDKVAKAVAAARGSSDGRVMKVIYLDEQGDSVGEWATKQVPENPFGGVSERAGLQEPPYPMEQLVFLAEQHPVHSSALEQKTADICGEGWGWTAENDAVADEAERDELEAWLHSLAPDDSDIEEIISSAWLDKETIGWGTIELARDPQGVLRKLYHVPGHTVRAHKDGFRLCQIRNEKKVWFRRWGAPDVNGQRIDVDAKSGSVKSVRDPANDLLVIRSPSRRSSWYGIPGYISGVGWITLAVAARDDNILFFHNRREPRWAIVITGLADDDDLEEMIRRAFTVDLKSPYRNVIIPLGGSAEIEFQSMSDTTKKDGSFIGLSERADKAILVAHRVPAERLANSEIGPLGGNNIVAANRIYKDAVVDPGQRLLNKRIRRLIQVEYVSVRQKALRRRGAPPTEEEAAEPSLWLFTLSDLDVTNEKDDLDVVVSGFKSDLYTLREARAKLKLGPLMIPQTNEDGEPELDADGNPAETESPLNDLLYTQLPGVSSYDDPSLAPSSGEGNRGEAFSDLERNVRSLLRSSREVTERLDALSDEYPGQ